MFHVYVLVMVVYFLLLYLWCFVWTMNFLPIMNFLPQFIVVSHPAYSACAAYEVVFCSKYFVCFEACISIIIILYNYIMSVLAMFCTCLRLLTCMYYESGAVSLCAFSRKCS